MHCERELKFSINMHKRRTDGVGWGIDGEKENRENRFEIEF